MLEHLFGHQATPSCHFVLIPFAKGEGVLKSGEPWVWVGVDPLPGGEVLKDGQIEVHLANDTLQHTQWLKYLAVYHDFIPIIILDVLILT